MERLNVSVSGFEGPLDLLLHLIEKNEIDIYDIPIAQLADQYLEYIESHSMESMAEFILMAATLLEIKSKLLLPVPKSGEPEADPRQELVDRLIEYKRFRQAADALASRGGVAERVFRAPDGGLLESAKEALARKPGGLTRELLGGVSLDALFALFESVVARQELKTDKIRSGFNSVRREVFTIDDKISFILSLLDVDRSIRFQEIFSGGCPRIEIVVTFLAVLELIKREEVRFRQESVFGDIFIFRKGA